MHRGIILLWQQQLVEIADTGLVTTSIFEDVKNAKRNFAQNVKMELIALNVVISTVPKLPVLIMTESQNFLIR